MTQRDLQCLFARPERPNRSVLSVYLNVDQSLSSNRNRGFEQKLKDLLASMRATIQDSAEIERFVLAAHRIEDCVRACLPAARGLIVFSDSVDGFSWFREIGVRIHNQARWNHELFLKPLANLLDQFERYGVVLAARDCLRLFTVFLNEIQEVRMEVVDPTTHLQRVIERVDELVQGQQAHHLVLAGTSKITSELLDRLPKRLATLVIGRVNISVNSAPQEVLAATQPIQQEYERDCEKQIVKELLRGASGNGKTVAGLEHTLNAVSSGRVWELVYSEGLSSPGFECSRCTALFSVPQQSCVYCGGSVDPVADVVERAVDHAVRNGARIEIVTGEAAVSLFTVGGVGAFLKAASVRP
jgi:peptide chain release factor subunit 1